MLRISGVSEPSPNVRDASIKALQTLKGFVGITLIGIATFGVILANYRFVQLTCLWYLIPLFVIGMTLLSQKVNEILAQDKVDLLDELNKPGDQALFEQATRTGNFVGYPPSNSLTAVVMLFGLFFSVFQAHSLQEYLKTKDDNLLVFALMCFLPWLILWLHLIMLNQRLLKECKRRNMFVPEQEKRLKTLWAVLMAYVVFSIVLGFYVSNLIDWSNSSFVADGR